MFKPIVVSPFKRSLDWMHSTSITIALWSKLLWVIVLLSHGITSLDLCPIEHFVYCKVVDMAMRGIGTNYREWQFCKFMCSFCLVQLDVSCLNMVILITFQGEIICSNRILRFKIQLCCDIWFKGYCCERQSFVCFDPRHNWFEISEFDL